MAVTILAVLFLVFIAVIALVRYRIIGRPASSSGVVDTEKCSICREPHPKHDLIERQIGDYKLLYFCRQCVIRLYEDLGLKN